MKKQPLVSRSSPGFTLVEMVVAVGLFAVVMLISVSSLLALIVGIIGMGKYHL
jgi:prepilin-type N-terminal cleavage/methylation domain-containing protein